MNDRKKNIQPNKGIPQRWLDLLRRTHEVGSRISLSITRTMDHSKGNPDADPNARDQRNLGNSDLSAG